jgi:GTP-binding protein SAR1
LDGERILFLGLDNAGKTTLMHMLQYGTLIDSRPTGHVQGAEVTIGSIKFSTYDVGGHKAARRLWNEYLAKIDGIVYLVDAADVDRLGESAEELNKLLQLEELSEVPFLILGNKIDKDGACSEEELTQSLGLGLQLTGKEGSKLSQDVKPVEVFMCSVVRRAGYADGFNGSANTFESTMNSRFIFAVTSSLAEAVCPLR